jgi:hypothetical protein
MAFACKPIIQEEFSNIEKLYQWVKDEEPVLSRVPIVGLIENGARFLDDEYFGEAGSLLKFNEKGMRSFCSLLGLKYELLKLIERPSLVCDLLNDLILQLEIQTKLASLEFVIDQRSDTIIGAVSDSYITYGNKEFLDDISRLLRLDSSSGAKSGSGRFEFISGFSINTQTIARFVLTVEGGKVSGKGGEGEDISKVGIQFKNSMVGDSAVTIDYFIHRLLCANGLIAPVGGAVNRVIHSGKKATFDERLKKSFAEVEKTIGRAGEMLAELVQIPFDPMLLAKAELSDRIFDIIPASRSTILDEKEIKRVPTKKLTPSQIIEREAKIIGYVPECFGGETSSRVFRSKYRDNASMFDFINVFTEHAKEEPPQARIEIEEKSGALADWIFKNKKKFVSSK